MTAVAEDSWATLQQRIAELPGIRAAEVTLDKAPVQIEAETTDGRWVYCRARWRDVWLGVGSDIDAACVNERGALELTLTGAGKFAAGHLTAEEAYHAFALLWSLRRGADAGG